MKEIKFYADGILSRNHSLLAAMAVTKDAIRTYRAGAYARDLSF